MERLLPNTPNITYTWHNQPTPTSTTPDDIKETPQQEVPALNSVYPSSRKRPNQEDHTAKPKTSNTLNKSRQEKEDNDIIILDHNTIDNNLTSNQITMLEMTTFHINCYTTRDVMAKDDLSKYTQVDNTSPKKSGI